MFFGQHFDKILLLSVIYLIASIMLLILNSDSVSFKLFFLGLIAAIITEITMVHFGVWSYPQSPLNILAVPPWIFLMWAVASVSVYQVGKYFQFKKP
jgi:uncharacterized membrane protein YoaT (DUF817 family)